MPKLPEFKDWQAPWVKNGTEFNAETAAKLVYDKTKDVEDLKEAHATKLTELTAANTELQGKVDAAAKAAMTDAERQAAEKKELETKLASAGDKDLENTRLRLALENNLTLTQAKRLVGTNEAELKADVAELLADLGLSKEGETGNEGGEGSENEKTGSRRQPAKLKNPLDNQGGDEGVTTKSLLEALPRF